MKKSRTITTCDLHYQLQLEWVCYRLRYATYPKAYREKYNTFCKGKTVKIEELQIDYASGKAPNIFDSEERMAKFYKELIPEFGLPKFQYRDKHCKDLMSKFDKIYYFRKKSQVEISWNGEIVKGNVVSNNIEDEILKVRISLSGKRSKIVIVDYNRARRVFTKKEKSILLNQRDYEYICTE